MTYTLLIGQRLYSSWSLRGWLPFEVFDIAHDIARAEIYGDGFARQVDTFAGGRSVPAALTPAGGRLTDSLAIAWHLAEAFPDRGLLPVGSTDRAMAQSLICEMHSGFAALRGACPMNLGTGWAGFEPGADVRADLDRIETLWSRALDRSGGPFLFGAYTLPDAFFAPVAARIAGFGLAVSDGPRAYVATHLDHGPFRRWRACGIAEDRPIGVYDQPLARTAFPVPAPWPAHPVDAGPSVNARCPFCGAAVTRFMQMDGRIWGFCNAFCRDKAVADPEAWPALVEMIEMAGPRYG